MKVFRRSSEIGADSLWLIGIFFLLSVTFKSPGLILAAGGRLGTLDGVLLYFIIIIIITTTTTTGDD